MSAWRHTCPCTTYLDVVNHLRQLGYESHALAKHWTSILKNDGDTDAIRNAVLAHTAEAHEQRDLTPVAVAMFALTGIIGVANDIAGSGDNEDARHGAELVAEFALTAYMYTQLALHVAEWPHANQITKATGLALEDIGMETVTADYRF